MDLTSFQIILSSSGQEALRAAMKLTPSREDASRHFQQLNRQFPRQLARTALEIAVLRGEADKKFPQADKMYFTREVLEQTSHYAVSRYRAERYRGFVHLADLGCSIGGDTLALAEIAPSTGIDRDPLRLAMARANLKALGLEASFIHTDLSTSFPCLQPPFVALFFDPTRRKNHQRAFSVKDYVPTLSVIRDWLRYFPALGVKIAPTVNKDELFGYDAEIEFISLHGNLKEAVLWFGPLKSAGTRATLLPGPHSLVDIASRVEQGMIPTLHLSVPLQYVYEPDPAVIQAGMIQSLRVQLGASQMDPESIYLTSSKKKTTPFAQVWEIEDWFPYQLQNLRTYLQERRVGQITVKKQGSSTQSEELFQSLQLSGDQERVVFLTQMPANPIVIICQPNNSNL